MSQIDFNGTGSRMQGWMQTLNPSQVWADPSQVAKAEIQGHLQQRGSTIGKSPEVRRAEARRQVQKYLVKACCSSQIVPTERTLGLQGTFGAAFCSPCMMH